MVMLRPVDRKEAARYLGYRDAEPDEIILQMMDECEKELSEAAHPAYTVGIFDIEPVNDTTVGLKDCTLVLTGKDIVKHLEGCQSAALMAVTLGSGVDTLLRKLQVTSMPKALVADAMAGAMIEQICNDVQAELSEKLPNMRQTWRFSPGYGDLPLAIQPEFLTVVEAPKRIGLSVTEGNMLTPVKSVTAVVGLQDMNKFSGHFSMDTPEDARTQELSEQADSEENADATAKKLGAPAGCAPSSCAKCAYHDKCGSAVKKEN